MQHVHKPNHRGFRCAVVRLPEIAVDAGRRRGEHDAPVVAFAHARPDRLRAIGRANQVHADDELEIRHLHLGEGLVTQHAGVVDEDVDAAPLLFRARRHRGHLLEIGDVSGVGHRDPAAGANLLHDPQRILRWGAASAEIIDDDFRAARRQSQRVGASEAGACAGDDRDPAMKLNSQGSRLAPRRGASGRPAYRMFYKSSSRARNAAPPPRADRNHPANLFAVCYRRHICASKTALTERYVTPVDDSLIRSDAHGWKNR